MPFSQNHHIPLVHGSINLQNHTGVYPTGSRAPLRILGLHDLRYTSPGIFPVVALMNGFTLFHVPRTCACQPPSSRNNKTGAGSKITLSPTSALLCGVLHHGLLTMLQFAAGARFLISKGRRSGGEQWIIGGSAFFQRFRSKVELRGRVCSFDVCRKFPEKRTGSYRLY